jgi:hypothetical protein
MVVVVLGEILRTYTDGENNIEVDATTVGEAIEKVNSRHLGFFWAVYSESKEEIRESVSTSINGEQKSRYNLWDMPLTPDDVIEFRMSIAGG